MMLADRARTLLNLQQYAEPNVPNLIASLRCKSPPKYQQVLRMLIKDQHEEMQLPDEVVWTLPLILKAINHQKHICRHPFMYLTIRCGESFQKTLDEWHVDGYSAAINHLPEQNYVWSDNDPTEFVRHAVTFPKEFDPLKHNIHKFLDNDIQKNNVYVFQMMKNWLYCLDPYIIHRRPPKAGNRAFVRITFCPIEIRDCNNTFNPLIPRKFDRDGVKDFRDGLTEYKEGG